MNIEVLATTSVLQSLYIDWEKEHNTQVYSAGPGDYSMTYNEAVVHVSIRKLIDNEHMLVNNEHRGADYIREIILDIRHEDAIKVMKQMMTDANDYVEHKFDVYMKEHTTIKKYIYLPDEGYWDLMNNTQMRRLDSLFLKEGEKENLLKYVEEFISDSMRQEYEKFDIPYKCNIMLYGRPGTGKTSTILSIASHLHMNIGLIPISKSLDDTKLIHAMNTIKRRNCKIIVLEDVDCLFMNRKDMDTLKNSLTLSGLLNCLDGFFRNEGIIIFLTANNISSIDEAMLRSCRMDKKMFYDYADEYQTKQCFNFYFPEKADQFDRFMNHMRYKQYTTAMLQQYFFNNRKEVDICKNLDEMDALCKSKETGVEEPTKHLYM